MSSISPSHRNAALTFIGLLLVAVNLRPALTSVSVILSNIGETFGFSSSALGILTTIPVLCLGSVALAIPWIVRRFGSERGVFIALIFLVLAVVIRPYTGTAGLFIGTAIAGACIGIIGILLPGIVKRDFPSNVGIMTGCYVVALTFGAALAAGITEPLRQLFNGAWQGALAFWVTPAVIAALIWLPQLRIRPMPYARRQIGGAKLRHDALAWQVTLFMGLQSSLAYIVFGWLPTLLQDRGLNATSAGLALSISVMLQAVTALAAPWIGGHTKDQRGILVCVMCITLAGLLGCIFAPLGSLWAWIVILGFGQGGTFSMALTLLALRAPDSQTAANLSAMAQGIGYLLAALGPLLVGLLHDWTGGWGAISALVTIITIGAVIAALGAGRNRHVVSVQ